jgi:nicotinate phosphoribosyltransferase
MAHSYVMSFSGQQEAFETFIEGTPEHAIMVVDTYDTLDGVRHAIAGRPAAPPYPVMLSERLESRLAS